MCGGSPRAKLLSLPMISARFIAGAQAAIKRVRIGSRRAAPHPPVMLASSPSVVATLVEVSNFWPEIAGGPSGPDDEPS